MSLLNFPKCLAVANITTTVGFERSQHPYKRTC